MSPATDLITTSHKLEALLGSPIAWCFVPAGQIALLDGTGYGGSAGGTYQVNDFALSKNLITNAIYQAFLDHPDGFCNSAWWTYSAEGALWRRDHHKPMPTAFPGSDLPRTRVSWFDGVAFCRWLAHQIDAPIRLPTEMEWQRAAIGDTEWCYPWGNEWEATRGNYANLVGQVTPVGSYPAGQSPYGVLDMIGNLWEWNLTSWGTDNGTDLNGYGYRNYRGGAWNVSNPEYLRAIDRGAGHSPRGRLNDAGFRIAMQISQDSV